MSSELPSQTNGASLARSLAYCRRPEHLRRTLRISLIVGVVLNAINESAPLLDGQFGVGTWTRVALNFVVPFVVSNVGLLSGRPR
ncbi:MAG: hypothetical protein NVSMB51_03010 [Solirubrobacteraceae bacterium]